MNKVVRNSLWVWVSVDSGVGGPLECVGGGQGGMSVPRRAVSMMLEEADLRGASVAGMDVEPQFELKTCINNVELTLNSFIGALEWGTSYLEVVPGPGSPKALGAHGCLIEIPIYGTKLQSVDPHPADVDPALTSYQSTDSHPHPIRSDPLGALELTSWYMRDG